MDAKEIENMLEELRSEIPVLLRALQLDTDFTPEGLVQIEAMLNFVYPPDGGPMPNSMFLFGFYLGEVIVRNIDGARWVTNEPTESLSRLVVEVPMRDGFGSRFSPFMRIQKFWRDRTDGLAVAYQMLSTLVDLGPENMKKLSSDPDGEGWRSLGKHMRFRMTEVKEP